MVLTRSRTLRTILRLISSDALAPNRSPKVVAHAGSRGLFRKSPETFRVYFGCHNSLYIFATPTFYAIELNNPLRFPYIKNMLKDQGFKTSGSQFDNCLFGTEKFTELSRNRRPKSTFFPSRFIFWTSLKGPLTQQQSNSQSKRSYDNGCLAVSVDPPSYDNRKKF